MLKAYKFRIYPTKEQIQKLNQFIGTSRFIYNTYLYKKIREKDKRITKMDK